MMQYPCWLMRMSKTLRKCLFMNNYWKNIYLNKKGYVSFFIFQIWIKSLNCNQVRYMWVHLPHTLGFSWSKQIINKSHNANLTITHFKHSVFQGTVNVSYNVIRQRNWQLTVICLLYHLIYNLIFWFF